MSLRLRGLRLRRGSRRRLLGRRGPLFGARLQTAEKKKHARAKARAAAAKKAAAAAAAEAEAAQP